MAVKLTGNLKKLIQTLAEDGKVNTWYNNKQYEGCIREYLDAIGLKWQDHYIVDFKASQIILKNPEMKQQVFEGMNQPKEKIIIEPNNIFELKNDYAVIAYNPNATYLPNVFHGRDLTDHYNEPACYSKTKQSHKRAWQALKNTWNPSMTMYGACRILDENGIRMHTYCGMD